MRILALQLKRIGDAILTAPALASVRAAVPHAQLSLVVASHSGALARAFSAVDDIVSWPPRLSSLATICTRSWDLVLDFTGSDRSALLSLASRAPHRLGYGKNAGKSLLRRLALTEPCAASVRECHTVDYHQALVGKFFGHKAHQPSAGTGFHVPKEAWPHHVPEMVGLEPGKYVVVHPGTFRPEKLWLSEHWAKVIDHCPLPILLTGNNDPVEMAHAKQILAWSRRNQREIINLMGRLSLLELAAVISKARLVLGVDSAAMHLAAMAERPQLGLFGPTNPFHWQPRHAQARVIHASGATTGFTPRFPSVAMSELAVGPVIEAMGQLLAAP